MFAFWYILVSLNSSIVFDGGSGPDFLQYEDPFSYLQNSQGNWSSLASAKNVSMRFETVCPNQLV